MNLPQSTQVPDPIHCYRSIILYLNKVIFFISQQIRSDGLDVELSRESGPWKQCRKKSRKVESR